MKFKLIGIITIILLLFVTFGVGYYFGHKYKKEDIIVEKVEVEDTVRKDKYLKLKAKHVNKTDQISVDYHNRLVDCYNSDFNISHTIDGDYLNVDISDACKSTQASFKIASKGSWNYYIAVPVALVAGYGGYKLYKKLK